MNTISSKEVAEMLGKRHDNFMRDIRKYITTLGEDAPKYFVEGTYKDGLNKVRAGYDITLAGCELIAGRIIGEKSTAFKEKYLEAFGAPKKEWDAPVMDPVSTDLTVEEVVSYMKNADRKSIPVEYCRENGVQIPQKKKRTRYSYDMSYFLGMYYGDHLMEVT